jgi:steroid delta-isomerase-like uncharacterized protein
MKFKILSVCLCVLFFSVSGYQNPAGAEISAEEAKTFVENVLKIYNDGNMAMIEECYSLDCIIHSPSFPEIIVGYESIKDSVKLSRIGFPDAKLTAQKVAVRDDTIMTNWTWTGTHTGPFQYSGFELPPTGKKVRVSGVTITQMKNYESIEEWIHFNVLEMLQPLGFSLLPPSGDLDINRIAEHIKRVMDSRDAEAISKLYAEDAVIISPESEMPLRGREAIRKSMESWLEAMSGLKIRFLTVMAMGNQIVFEQLVRAKHTGSLAMPGGEIPPTGRSVKFKSVWFAKINEDGLIVEDRTYFDTASLMKQLGFESGETN